MLVKKLISVVVGIIISFLLCEMILRIYNPFQSRIRGNEIILKSNYRKKFIIDPPISGLNKEVYYSTNSIGFRGAEPPEKWDEHITILTVGGSTTESSMLSDDSTWTARLNGKLKSHIPEVWINNAGLDGCSTYGHIILLRDYIIKLKPDYAVFLIGANDLGRDSFENEDGFLINRKESVYRTILKRSELITTISNFIDAIKARKLNLAHGSDPTIAFITTREEKQQFEQLVLNSVGNYIERVQIISDLCRKNNIQPVFLTQPLFAGENEFIWKSMLTYNDSLINYCKQNDIIVIDLGRMLAKEDKQIYYDPVHYTNYGSKVIADLLFPEFLEIIKNK